jgi:ribonuclease-3
MNEDILSQYKEKLEELEASLSISYSEPMLLLQAVTHDSFYKEQNASWGSNERLEFLGDSVIGLLVSRLLYTRFPDFTEGSMAQMKAYLVSTEFLAEKAREIDLGKYLLLGKGEEQSGGRERHSLLADAYEAVIGSFYLDQGIDTVERYMTSTFAPSIEEVTISRKNSKSLLQEHIQKHFKCLPLYTVIKEEGPPHQKTFHVRVYFKGEILGEGSGASKKEAEKESAKVALNNFEAFLSRELIQADPNGKETEQI